MTHLIALHDQGGTNPLGISSNKSLINFHPYYTLKDVLGFIIMILFLLIFVFFYPNSLSHPDNYIPGNLLVTPTHIVPE
jgi:ubiquinol-cytochrome c reductase cytochrome b subunit